MYIFLAFIWQLEPMSRPFYSWLVYSLGPGTQLTFGDVQLIVWLWRAGFWSWNRNWRSARHFLWESILFHWVVYIFTMLLANSFFWIWHIHTTAYNRAKFVKNKPGHFTEHWILPGALRTTFLPSWPFHKQKHSVLQWPKVPKPFRSGLDKVTNI